MITQAAAAADRNDPMPGMGAESLAVVRSRAALGLEAPEVDVEVHLSGGLPGFSIVGLPETAVRESKDRVRGALLNAGFDFPRRRITVNLAPADLPKEGGRFDLPIALGILAASGQVPAAALARLECVGELALTGALRSIRGVLAVALAARDGGRTLLVPSANLDEAGLVEDLDVCGAADLLAVTAHLRGGGTLAAPAAAAGDGAAGDGDDYDQPDLADVRGQRLGRRALEVAAAGRHSLLMIGPPGTGKSMLAARLPGLLPPLTQGDALAVAVVQSVAGDGFRAATWRRRPFRAPHHGASAAALVGGGARARPGEISLAHHGVLFLDELPEFSRHVLEALREPLETGAVTISRAACRATYPAEFQLVAAMNPCPCGWLGDASGRCRCTAEQVQRYRNRISGPLLERIDMHVEMPAVPHALLRRADTDTETTATVRVRVVAARARQLERQGAFNSALQVGALERHCRLDEPGHALLDTAMERLQLSARSYHRILRLARTIADLARSESIQAPHIAEAVQLRCLDRPSAA